MILYRGEKHENTYQTKLLDTLQKDCLDTLSQATKLETSLVINACHVLSQDIVNGKFDHIIKPLLLSYDIPKELFSKYVSMFTKESLDRKVEIELGSDYLSLSNLNEENERHIYPLGILFHIAAGNVDALPAYSVIEGLLVGNINILKLPTGDKGLSVQLLSELIKIEPKLRDYIYVFDVPSTEVETLKTFANMADAIVVWGGDEAVKATRRMASINTKIIEWGHKLSFAYASIDASDDDLIGLARSVITSNQLLCSSAQGIYLDTNDRNTLDVFANRFFNLFVEIQKEYQLTPFGIRSKNAVELYYEEMVQEDTGKKIWKKDGISVLTSDDNKLELSLLYRNVWIKMLPIKELVTVIKPSKNHLQTATILAPKEIYYLYQDKLVQSGIVRIKKASEMSDALLGESHDGMFPLRLYSRVVEVYKK